MGITCSGPSAKFPFAALSGENCGFSEVATVCLSAEGFVPSEVCLHEGEYILFEWGEEISTHFFNVVQVTGPDCIPVPGGYNSGEPTKSGWFKVHLGRKGLFMFQSESLPDKLKTLNVYVLEKPSIEVKITSKGFETQLVNIQEGEAVHWRNENEDSNNQCLVQEMEYCFKHGGFLPKTPRIQVERTFQSTFPNTGLHFFYLENHGADSGEGHVTNLICVVKVTQRNSDFSVHIVEDGLQPELISAAVQDRIWLDCSLGKNPSKTILDAYIYKNGAETNHLVSARLSSTSNSRLVELVSYQFSEPGLYHYVYVMTDLSEIRGHVLVQHKPTEHLVEIVNGRFNPGLCTVKQGDRVWWTFKDEESFTWCLQEAERCVTVKGSSSRRKSSNSGCCRKAKDQSYLIGCLGLLSHRFDETGVFTYCLQDDKDASFPQDTCTILVQKNVKHHTIRVRDRGFTPRILNVHPGDWVWWHWEDTKRQHNIVQVSHQRIVMLGGIQSGEPTHLPNAFSSVFKELGIFYFASNGLPEVFGAIVVTPEPQVHRIEVTNQGIHPDPLLISVNDCVAWVWSDGEGYEVQEYSNAVNECGSARRSRDYVKRCHSRVIRKPGMYHFLFTPNQIKDNELGTRPSDSSVHTILADPISYSSMVEVAADGFRPSTLTIEKSQSVLWTWENRGSQEHNILHVRPPQADEPLARVRGLSAFDSGPVTTSSTFFHTFDVPGTYFVTSEGTERALCVIDVKENAAFVSPPKISSNTTIDGGNVQKGHRVFLECDTQRAEMFYTLDGSYPAEWNRSVMPYDDKKGVVLDQTGFVVVRAVAKKDNWVTSEVYTSNRFWVIQGDSVASNEVSAEEEEFLAESEKVVLKERPIGSQVTSALVVDTSTKDINPSLFVAHGMNRSQEGIFHFHWLNCRPSISLQLVCDNTFHLDITLGSTTDLSWIRGFQLYLNGTAYGGWLGPACRGLVISGLIGGKHYHVVLVVFPTYDSYQPQLSNEVVITCPLRSSSGGPLVSLEASTTPQSLIIVWPAISGPANVSYDEVTTYSVFINGQPFGEQIVPEPGSRYSRVLFESSLENEVYTLCVASCLSGSDVLLYSNEVEFSLPIPDEILSALENPEGQSDSLGRDGLDNGTPSRELLLVAERINSSSYNTSISNIEKLCVKSSFGKLQTIFEGDDVGDCDFKDKTHEGKHGDTEVNTNEGSLEVTSVDEEGHKVVTDERFKECKVTTNGMLSNAPLKQGPVDAEDGQQKSHSESLGQAESSSFLQDLFPVDNQESIDSPLDETNKPSSEDFPEGNVTIDEPVSKSNASSFENHVDIVREKELIITAEEAVITKCQPSSAEDYDRAKLETDVKPKEVSSSFSTESNDNCSLDQIKEMHVPRSDESQQMSHKGKESLPIDESNGSNICSVNTANDDQQKNAFEKGTKCDSENWNYYDEEDAYTPNEPEAAITSKYFELAAGDSSFPAEKTEAEVAQTNEQATYSNDSENGAILKASNALASGQKRNEMKEEENDTSENQETVVRSTNVLLENPSEHDGIPDVSYIQEARTLELNKVDDRVGDEESTMKNLNTSFENSKRLENYALSKEIEGQVSEETAGQKMEGYTDEFGEREGSHLEGREERVTGVEDVSDSVKTMVKSEASLNKSCKGNSDGATENPEFINDELTDETWSKSSSCGSFEDEEKTNVVAAAVMPTFEETDQLVDARSLPLGILGSDDVEGVKSDMDEKTETFRNCKEEEFNMQEIVTSSAGDILQEFKKPLPRPLLVVKGTTPTTVILEWEWTLLPEQIAGSDIVYTVLVLGRKFQSNINSNFCFDFKESPASCMWENQNDVLLQHAWRTTNTVIEITGMKQRRNYRMAVLGQLMPLADEALSQVILFTMPGPPKSPVIHVTDLKNREVTLSWKPAVSFGEATIEGYRLLRDGTASCDDLGCERRSVTINALEEGKEHRFNLLAVTCHSVGDSKSSNTVRVFCPTPPMSPQISHKKYSALGSICIVWKRDEFTNTDGSEDQAMCSDIVFVDDMPHGECPLTGELDILTGELSYTIPNLEIGRKYEIHVKSYLNPRVIDVEGDRSVYVCGCYGESSNVLELFCAGPPSSPILRVSRIDQSGVTLSWSRSSEFGGVTLAGYILQVNNKWSGEILPAEQCHSKLTGFKPGEVICVRLTAVTYDLPGPLTPMADPDNNESRCFSHSYEQPDSGVESSSSFLSKWSADETKHYACSADSTLVIQYSNLVKPVSSIELVKVEGWSASITWSLDETADRSVAPDVLRIFCWKSMEDEESAVKYVVTDKPFTIKGLDSKTEYRVFLECSAPHINDDSYKEHPINVVRSQCISFITASPPGPVSNIYVVSATEESIRLAWDNPTMHGDSIAAIRVNVRRNDHEIDDGFTIQLSPETRSFTFDSLSPKTEYAFVFETLKEDDFIVMHDVMTDSVAHFSAFTNGMDPPGKVKLVSRTPTSILITWEHADAYGMSIIQRYRVHCVLNRQLRKRSRGRFVLSKNIGKVLDVDSETCRAEIRGLDPGVVYKIVVEAVAGNTDYSYDDDFESDGSGTSSAASSVLSEKPPGMQRLYFSQPFLVCTSAPLEPPVLMVSGFNASQIHLSWRKPLVLVPVSDPHCAAEEDAARGRVRRLRGYRLEVNGRVYARLAADKTSITLRKCKSSMKYTCVLVAMSGPEKMEGCQGKNARTLDTAINDTDTDEEMATKALSDCFEESASDPVEVTLPRQDLGISMCAKYSANKLAESFRDSANSDSEDEEGGVVVQWTVNELSGDVRGFRLFWYNNKRQEKNEVLLPLDATSYEIWSVLQSAVYTISLEILDDREEALAVFGPLYCQTPGPPAPPWIWYRSLSPYQFTIEWNEPVTHGDVNIRAYQVYLNDRRLEKLVDRGQRRVTIHCQSSSLYRVSLVALGSDPQYGDSYPSNVLKLCTPVAEDPQAMTLRPLGPHKRTTFDINIHVTSIANTRIAFEWSHPPNVVDTADHYIVKWSSVLKPQVEDLTLPLIQTSHEIDSCFPGTSHFLVVAAVTADGDLVSRSKQLTVQTSAPIKQPCLQVKSCLQSCVTIQWHKPTTFGDAEIDHFKLMLNRSLHRKLDADCTSFFFSECEPCKEYTFYLKAVSSKPDCDSEWSEPLIVTCPGALRPLITRIRSNEINCIRVGWKGPVLRGDAQVDSYRVYYARDSNALKVTVDDVITNPQAVEHGPLPWYTTEDKIVPIPPDSNYWVVLQVDLMPGDCQPVYSQPIKTRAAVTPDPPVISLEIEGLEARRGLEQRICQLSIKRDKLHRMIYLLESSVVVKGSKMKDLQIVKATDAVLEVDSDLADLLENIKEYTGMVSCVVKWCRPCDDGDAIVSGYQLFVDDKRLGEPLSPSTLESRLKLPVSCHKITVQTLTDHPIGPSPCSNVVELPGSEFVPFVLFCYFDVHKCGEGWPRNGCCSWNDSHKYEIRHRGTTPPRVFVPLGILSRRIPCPVFEVIDPFSGVWRSLAPCGVNKMSALLFWTKWCFSSQKVLGYFSRFAEEFSEKFSFITCCVRSNELDASHRQSLAETLIERNWRKTSNCVTHNCACNLRSQRSRSVRRGVVSEPDVCQMFGLVGVPTLIILDSSGYISWHGRCSYFDFASFRSLLLHAFSQVSRSNCPVTNCLSYECETDDEYVPRFPEYVDHIDEPSSSIRRKVSFESNTLYQRLHGSSQVDVSSQTQTIKKKNSRPKTTTAMGRLARSTGYNRPIESNELKKVRPRPFTAHGGVHPSRTFMARPGSVLPPRVRALERTSQSSLDEVSFPAATRQRDKEATLSGRIRAPRIKSKISVEDLPLW